MCGAPRSPLLDMKTFLVTAPTVVAGFVLIAAAWLLFAPAELGGATRYAVVEGASMEPGLSRGDLVLVRGGGDADVGDAVLYRDPTLGVRVLHRVIAKEDGRLVLQGDANDFVDDARPRPSDVIGAYWFSIPRAGSASLLAAAAASCGAARVRADDRRAGRRRGRSGSSRGGSAERMNVLSRSGRAPPSRSFRSWCSSASCSRRRLSFLRARRGVTPTPSPPTSSSRVRAWRSRWLASGRAPGTFNDTAASNLVLGSASVDTIRGMNGNDCILGGAANDSLRGDGGTDVCIGGTGTDTFHSTCETQIQ